MTLFGITTLVRFLQLAKPVTEVMVFGRVSVPSNPQELKALSKVVTVFGMVRSPVNPEHPWKAADLMVVRPLDSVSVPSKPLQPLKAYDLIVVTLLGMTNEPVKPVQSWNVF